MTLRAAALLFAITFLPVAYTQTPATAPAVDGAWLGTLHAGAANPRIIFHITSSPSGLSATLDSPDQGIRGLPTNSTTLTGNTLTINAENLHITYTGTLSLNNTILTGTWSQSAHTFPLTLTHVTNPAELAAPKRPQDPTPPFPYKSIDVTYANPIGNDTLAATLTIPPGSGPFPAVLLIPGSGPHDRNETIFDHKPFLVLADYLTRHGIIVLRADDRGVGHSTGSLTAATTADLATDAEAGLAFLHSRPEVDAHRIGLIGHSEGGIIAPMVAAHNKTVAFIVLLAAPGVPGSQLIPEQVRLLALASGLSSTLANQAFTDETKLIDLALQAEKNPQDAATFDQQLRTQFATVLPANRIDSSVKIFSSPWFRFFLSYDPATALRHVTCPVFALNGSKDIQVSATQNLPAIRAALAAAGNTRVVTTEIAGLNHLFQPAGTGGPTEYAQIETTIDPEVLSEVSNWIKKQP
jgi:fermentation-respiration switch protein FrsA (DUF1100 family)